MPFSISTFDIIDIFLVAIILFQLYRLIRGTAAFSIFIAIFLIYLFWLIVKALNMELISALLGQVIGVGVIALIIVFQQEVRRFLLVLGNRYIRTSRFSFFKFFSSVKEEQVSAKGAEEIARACEAMASSRTGALIVIGRKSSLVLYAEGGEVIKAKISSELLKTIFFKNTPLHDGAVLIENGLIVAARCPLPITDQVSLPPRYGMRHRAAIGMSEQTDALIIVVSEESGFITVVDAGSIKENIAPNELRNILLKEKIW
ncbi:MAG TPA: diadenylate cyclase CdaA [Bacteroidales bacterium]|nr:diadenylate cyclase CdaA [Bacteroidales bacterium]HPT22093.1 diadenylate cyclase CdaA [Bacteroidales bacterium]